MKYFRKNKLGYIWEICFEIYFRDFFFYGIYFGDIVQEIIRTTCANMGCFSLKDLPLTSFDHGLFSLHLSYSLKTTLFLIIIILHAYLDHIIKVWKNTRMWMSWIVLSELKLFLQLLGVCSGFKHKAISRERKTQANLYWFLSQTKSSPVPCTSKEFH
jgi:hypothetical protein